MLPQNVDSIENDSDEVEEDLVSILEDLIVNADSRTPEIEIVEETDNQE